LDTTPALKSRHVKATQLLDADDDREPTIAEQIDAMTDPSFMTSLARGLAVLRAFSDARKPQTIASISQKTGIPRAAVRRCLHTLCERYVDAELNNFSLRPKVLTLGIPTCRRRR
jgi:IclR family pca regulon transcriptional regulator